MARPLFKLTSPVLLPALFVCLVLAEVFGQEPANPGRLAQTKEEQLATAPEGFTLIAVYADGLKALYSNKARATSEIRPRCDLILEDGQRFDNVILGEVRHSPDGRHLAFAMAALDPKGRVLYWNAVHDGKVLDYRADGIRAFTFSPDSSRLAFTVARGKEVQVYTPNKPDTPGYENVSKLTFSSDSRHLAYGALRSRQRLFVLDGQTAWSGDMPRCPAPVPIHFSPAFSPDGKSWAFAVSDCQKGWSYYVNGKAEATSYSALSPFQFSPDGHHTAYAGAVVKSGLLTVMPQTIGTVVVDGKESGRYELRLTNPVIVHRREPGEFNNVNTPRLSLFPENGVTNLNPYYCAVSNPVYGADGRHLVYRAQLGRAKAIMVVDGQSGPEFDLVLNDPELSPDGQHIGYLAMQNQELLQVLDGKVTSLGNVVPADSFSIAEEPRLAPEGKHFASIITKSGFGYTAGLAHARRRVLLDGKLEKEYDCMSMSPVQFSSDGEHYAYMVRGIKDLNGKSLVVVDGFEGPAYDSILGGIDQKMQGASVTFYAVRDGKLYRVTDLAPSNPSSSR